MTNSKAYFVAGLRTPFGRSFKGAYAEVRPDDLMVELIQGHRERFPGLWQQGVEEFILGCAYPEGEQGYNVARPIALGAGLSLPAMTINRLCASSLDAAISAAAKVKAGFADRVLVGGVESMSRIPRRGANFSESDRIKLSSPNAYIPNGDTAEKVARQYANISRQQQEEFSARSHELADAAYAAGRYQPGIFPWKIAKDEFIRVPVDRAKMASLAPAFSESGVVTAATSSPLTDGGTLGCVIDESSFDQYVRLASDVGGLEIVDVAVGHVAPDVMGLGPVPATKKLLQRNGLSANDIAAWEINEAFAIQVLASMQELGIEMDRVNHWGGALALGHPLGASGLRLLITLLSRLTHAGTVGSLGVATLCVGGGQGVSVLVRYAQGA
jgi:acetyl-CoA acyltransferase